MTQYSIFTTVNDAYFPFIDIFINSALKNCNKDNLKSIYVSDIGLNYNFCNYLKSKDKVILLQYDKLSEKFTGVHDNCWTKSVSQKTKNLNSFLKTTNIKESLILIDSDTFVLKDLAVCIDKNFDILATTMADGGHLGASGVYIEQIASFLVMNDMTKSKIFLNKWIENIKWLQDNKKRPPHETPGMNMTLKQLEESIKFGYLSDNIVCADQTIFNNTLTIHFKSNGSNKDNAILNFEKRINLFKTNNKNFDINFLDYLNTEQYNLWKKLVDEQII